MMRRMQTFERDTLRAVAKGRALFLVHFVVNALLIVALFYWTRIPEQTVMQFTFTLVSGFAIAFATLWLHAATFDYFGLTERKLKLSLQRSVSKIPAFFIWCVLFGFGLWLIGELWAYGPQTGGYVRHVLPVAAHSAVTPRTAISVTFWLIWLAYFFLWPILMLAIGAQVAVRNLSGFFSFAGFRPLSSLRFWILYAVCFALGAYVPYKLVWMTPKKASSLNHETWSMVIRFGFAYLLMVTAWIILCAAIMRASDEDGLVDAEVEPINVVPIS